jgi:hypothetical protein
VPDRCDASACIGGRDCEHLSFCIEARRGYALGGPFVEDVAHGRCDVDADCALGERCEASDVCIDRTAIRTRRIAWSVGALALVTVAALAVVVRRRAAKPR